MRSPLPLMLASLVAHGCGDGAPTRTPIATHVPPGQSLPVARSTIDLPTLPVATPTSSKTNPPMADGSKATSALQRTDVRIRTTLSSGLKASSLPVSLAKRIDNATRARLDLHIHLGQLDFISLWFSSNNALVAILVPVENRPFLTVRYQSDHADHGWYDSNGYRTDEGPLVIRPLDITRITSRYGKRFHPIKKRQKKHQGADYAAPAGTPVHAVAAATVKTLRVGHATAGTYVVLQHANGEESRYMHLRSFKKGLRTGTTVKQADVIGYVGATGAATGPHLHFEYHRSGWPMDPLVVQKPAGLPLEPIGKAELQATIALVRAAKTKK